MTRWHKIFACALVAVFTITGSCAFGKMYKVGPDQTYENVGDVPWESLTAGDTVRIYWRDKPYKEKFVIAAVGTASQPVTVSGVPNEDGLLPIIDGNNATIRKELSYWGDNRSTIKIGGATKPHLDTPEHIILEKLDICSARPPYRYTDFDGRAKSYALHASPVWIESGKYITIRNCIIRDGANGILSSHWTEEVVIEGCYIHGNGMPGGGAAKGVHNTYTESHGITYQYNRFGSLRDGCLGNSLKDRSSGTIVRHNWLEGGTMRLSLVESDYQDIRDEPRYRNTYLYGNIFIHDGVGDRHLMRYGGDQGPPYDTYRKGMLFMYNNTIIWTKKQTGITYLMKLNTKDESVDFRNNLLYFENPSAVQFAVFEDWGKMVGFNNWNNVEWTDTYWPSGIIDVRSTGNIVGTNPQFHNFASMNLKLLASSPCIDQGVVVRENTEQYQKHQKHVVRPDDGQPDIGAYENIEVEEE